MDKKSEDILKDILYKIKNDLDIDLNDTWMYARISQFLEDMWNAGYDNGLANDDQLEKEYQRGYKEGQNDYQESVRDSHDTGYNEGYSNGYEDGHTAGDKDGYQRALSRFDNPDIG